ncbi:MAG: hypothetical protein ABR874_11270 [Candidatus Sulfotelmatobacter sp.]
MTVLLGCRLTVFAAVVTIAARFCPAQNLPSPLAGNTTDAVEKVSLATVSVVEIPSLPVESIAAPVLCLSDGGVLLRLAMPGTGLEDPVSISEDGKTVVRFDRNKINDISRPTIRGLFPKGTDVYVLVMGSTPLGYEMRLRKPNDEVVSEPASKASFFVGRFRRDGTYAGSVPLELPFKPLQFGVFDDGDFLIAGMDPRTSEPRVAVVASNGQLRRLLELKGDVHELEGSPQDGGDRDPTALPRNKPWGGFAESLRDVVFTSQIAGDGSGLLLFRPSSGPMFSISPAGAVRARKLGIQGVYRLFTVKRARDSWIVEYIHDIPGSTAQEFSTYEFDPRSGGLKREYFFPADLGWGLACADGDEFTFIIADEKAGMLKLVKRAPQGRAR